VEAEFHFDRYNPLSPKQHKETANAGAGILKDGPHLIDQAVYLFGFPQSVYADIRTTREHFGG
jgi:predicted dehydrogenase